MTIDVEKILARFADVEIGTPMEDGLLFDNVFYLTNNLDVLESHYHPFEHFTLCGRKEGRAFKILDPLTLLSDSKSFSEVGLPKSNDTNISVLDFYVRSAPSPQWAIDLFANEWSSQFPQGSGIVSTPGLSPLFEDQRVTWANTLFGGFSGKTVLELGPLELGHTFMLQQYGAVSIDSVESNSRAFMKCLIAKEILKVDRANILLGDFVKYLEKTEKRYDWIVASGILYHMQDPLRVLELISEHCSHLMLWTHYYDANVVLSSETLRKKFDAPRTVAYSSGTYEIAKYKYLQALDWQGFCGGPEPDSSWLTKDSLLRFLEFQGFPNIEIASDDLKHPNGPAILLCASK